MGSRYMYFAFKDANANLSNIYKLFLIHLIYASKIQAITADMVQQNQKSQALIHELTEKVKLLERELGRKIDASSPQSPAGYARTPSPSTPENTQQVNPSLVFLSPFFYFFILIFPLSLIFYYYYFFFFCF